MLTGKLFGKDIYEIDYTDDIITRLNSDETGYSSENEVVYIHYFDTYVDPSYCRSVIRQSLRKYSLKTKKYYKVNFQTAIRILDNNVYVREEIEEPVSTCFGGTCTFLGSSAA